ncbi:AAA family ATPase [Halostagnicola sp. A-GB9-2]|uniref:Cdc6/Cdc18 family protein n=1 Tax=Halostagnicola sp. A-GB9-2 TaxID=3048066 RepID=UPI0024BF4A04|nr:AAA family ATPase [Halostagnicola sp. A-GB9-2]MDJ1432756.1 AAA family ATPase [Halostagnicola sp. A-GB9-2]
MSDDELDMTDSDRDVELGGPDGFSTELKGSDLGDEEPNQGLFDDLLSGEPIFENKEVLRPSYTPHELPHRSDQINKMATILVAALRGETPSNILIYGKTGTGKTASAKFVSKELESTSTKYSVPCDVEYINCEVTDTQYRVLAQLANKFIEENERRIDTRLEELRSLVDSVEEFDATNERTSSLDREQDSATASNWKQLTEGRSNDEEKPTTKSGSSANGDSSGNRSSKNPETDTAVDQTSITPVESSDSDSVGSSGDETSPHAQDTRPDSSGSRSDSSGSHSDATGSNPSTTDSHSETPGAPNSDTADSDIDLTSGGSPVETKGSSDGDDTTSSAVEPSSHPLESTPFDSIKAIEDRIAELEEDKESFEEVPMTGWPTDRVYSVFFDAVDYSERVVVIMLDEIDKLVEKSGDDTLYNLSRMNSELENSRVSIIGISNDLKFTDFLDPRVKSSLGEEEIVFPPYDANQLRDILQHRSEVAFKGGALSGDVIPLCAAFAAQEHGDARRALDLLRTAGELAERSQSETIVEEHVRQAQDKIELDRVVEVVRTLPTQSKLVLFSIISLEKNGVQSINTGEVFNIYKRLCEEIDADVLTQRRVTDLISELDMLGIVNAVVVSKGRYGRTKEISLSVPLEETEAVLLSDSRLSDIDDIQPFVQARFEN